MEEGLLLQLGHRLLLQDLRVVEHLVGGLHLLQAVHRQAVLLQHFHPSSLQQLLHLYLVGADEVDVLVLVDLADEPPSWLR